MDGCTVTMFKTSTWPHCEQKKLQRLPGATCHIYFPPCGCAVRPTGPPAFKEESCADRTLTTRGSKPTNWLRLQLLRLRAYLPAPSPSTPPRAAGCTPPLEGDQEGHVRWGRSRSGIGHQRSQQR